LRTASADVSAMPLPYSLSWMTTAWHQQVSATTMSKWHILWSYRYCVVSEPAEGNSTHHSSRRVRDSPPDYETSTDCTLSHSSSPGRRFWGAKSVRVVRRSANP
jgi:hypothetical protein